MPTSERTWPTVRPLRILRHLGVTHFILLANVHSRGWISCDRINFTAATAESKADALEYPRVSLRQVSRRRLSADLFEDFHIHILPFDQFENLHQLLSSSQVRPCCILNGDLPSKHLRSSNT